MTRVCPVSLRISLTHHCSLPTGRALLPSDQETDALGSRVRLQQKCDYSVFSTGCCSGEEGDPRWRLIFGFLPGLRSCLLIWQILGDSPCFLSSLKYMSGKSLRPHRPCCVCGNGDRLGGGGETGWLAHDPPSGCGKKSWPRQALCGAAAGPAKPPGASPAILWAQPGRPARLSCSAALTTLTRDHLGHPGLVGLPHASGDRSGVTAGAGRPGAEHRGMRPHTDNRPTLDRLCVCWVGGTESSPPPACLLL